jgi:phosphoglycolate phosphatase
MKKGIIFDLDGTMWDSVKQIVPAYNRVFSKYGETKLDMTEEIMKKCMGKTLKEIGQMLFPQMEVNRREKMLSECCQEECVELKKHGGGTLYPKLKETLEKLNKCYSLFIVSNCENGYIEAFLESHELKELFDDFEYVGRTGKPKAENIIEIIKRNRLDRAAYVGDTQKDLDSADTAGVPFIYAAYGFGKVNRETPSIGSFAELPEVIERVI